MTLKTLPLLSWQLHSPTIIVYSASCSLTAPEQLPGNSTPSMIRRNHSQSLAPGIWPLLRGSHNLLDLPSNKPIGNKKRRLHAQTRLPCVHQTHKKTNFWQL